MKNRIKKQYGGVKGSLDKYWHLYEGWPALLSSPYFHLALLVTALSFPAWSGKPVTPWYETVTSIIPNMLGFTLGGYAILLAFGDDFLDVACGEDPDGTPSPFMKNNAAITHFLIVQVTTLLYAVMLAPHKVSTGIFAAIGYASFVYTICTALAAILAIFNISSLIDKIYSQLQKNRKDDCKCICYADSKKKPAEEEFPPDEHRKTENVAF